MTANVTVPSIPAAFDAADANASTLLIINLDALRANYRTLRDLAANADCAAVIKANAYGSGLEASARALAQEGCSNFFVATFGEALSVQKAVPDANVYVLDGLLPDTCDSYVEAGLIPVLSDLDQAREWAEFCESSSRNHPAALHVDTGMNRLGLRPEQVPEFAQSCRNSVFSPSLIMSHLTCSEETDHAMNERQLSAFKTVSEQFPDARASFANSGGIALGPAYHFDLVRAGIALYGAVYSIGRPPLAPVAQLYARIARIDDGAAGETVGYGARDPLTRDTRIATICLGYADGLPRRLSAGDELTSLIAHIDGHPAPVLGRVSMDLITLDVTNIPDGVVKRGRWAEIIGPNMPVDDLAERADTISYELLTNLSRRAQRIYVAANAKS